ncbi:MAG: D-glycerate dehydrogenase [Sphingopyxis sp.]|uniref:2-hydroxyacid dehydrogenase n=1 Tax=Sphingopyxis sp. TaxID=1908224 RepID=UPI002ABCE83C|nr:D-glycerate dehydrogenase [Sphingopyxis sp.]MDZ3832614.1 D-glycerate dehydrogenase [Sphingopyxis sp.]
MSITIATSRPMPLPTIELAGQAVHFVPPEQGIPDNARVYLGTAVDPVDAALIDRFPGSIGLIANLGVGYDNIDRAAAARRGIQVSNTPVVTEDTADLAFGLILAAARRMGEGERYVRGGGWSESGQPPRVGIRVHGAKLGLVGFGAIGQAVARRAQGFGMDILYHCPHPKPAAAAVLGARYCSTLDELLGAADILSLHAPLSDATRGMIDATALAACKPGAVLVNSARGALVDEDALIAALHSGHIAAAGLDVFVGEPAISPGFLALDQVVLTPHIGSATAQCRFDVVQRGIANIAHFLETGTVLDPVPLPEAIA